MKNLKFIVVSLLLLFAFISKAEFSTASCEHQKFNLKNNVTASKLQLISSSTSADAKENDDPFTVKKKIKYRATTSESTTLNTPYLIKLVDFKIFKNRLIYGIPSIYQIQRYTYLHLYQLF